MSPLSVARRSFVYRRLLAAQMMFASIGNAGLVQRADASSEPGPKLIDLSVLPRWGLKGRDTFIWLTDHGAIPPNADNTAELQPDGSLIARISPGEALILSSPVHGRSNLADAIDKLPAAGEGACYPAPRRDSHCWFVVAGEDVPRMFAKICGVDLAPDRFPDRHIAQTSVARLSAIVIRHDVGGSLTLSVLAESASAEYLWDCLVDAMTEFFGAICGAEILSKPR